MLGAEDCSLFITKESDSLDQGRHSKMFRHSHSPFSLMDLDMWDTKPNFTAQTSAWCGMATVSGTGFLSKVSTSTCGSTGGLRQNDPGLRRWQSLSHLAPDGATRPFPSSLGAELQATRGECSFRQSEVVQWLQDAHERLDTQLDRLRTRDAQLRYHITTAQLSDMKHKQLSEVMSTLDQEKEATKSSQFEKSQQRRQIHEKVQTLEKDLLQMRSTLDRGSDDHPPERSPGSRNRSLPKQMVDTELCELREAETRAKTQQVEQNQFLQQLHSSAEIQKTLLNQIEELNQRLGDTLQNHSEMQEELTEANNKISQACLEKAILSTQVLKLEDNIKDLKAKLTEALSEKNELIQEKADQVLGLQVDRTQPSSEGVELHDNAEAHNNNKQDKETVLMNEESKVLKEVNDKLTCELEMIKQRLEMLQCQLQEVTAERINSSKHITDLEANKSQLISEKEELLRKMNRGECEIKEECCHLRESVEVLQLEKQKLQDQCMCLEAKLLEKEEKLHLQEDEYRKQDAARVQTMGELKATISHWIEKWQNVALTLQTTQEDLKELKKNNSRNELQVEAGHLASEIENVKEKGQKDKEQTDNLLQQKASMERQLTDNKKESLLRVELDACKQELELERSRSQMLLHRCKDKGGEAVQTQDKGTETDLSNFSLLWVPPQDSHSRQHKSPQVFVQNSEAQWLKKTLAEREKELQEKAEAFKTLEKLRENEKTEAQIKISALELKLMKKTTEDDHHGEGQANASIIESLRVQLEESRRRVNQLQQEKMLAVQRLQTLKQLYPIKDENTCVKGKNNTIVHLETDQQRRMVTEQLKNLFKKQEEKEMRKVDNTEAAAAASQTEPSAAQDWIPTPTVVRTAVDRWNWQQSSGLTPVLEEDEEDSELQEKEEGEPGEEDCSQESIHNQRRQMSAMSAEHISVKAQQENLLRALRFKQPLQDRNETTVDAEVPNLCHCSNEHDLQQEPYFLYPDGIFLAELVNTCSPDEDEEEGEDK